MKPLRSITLLLVLLAGTCCEFGRPQPVCEDLRDTCEQLVQVHFHYGFENELNTFELAYQKDLVMDGVISTDFWFTTAEQLELLAKVEQFHFYQMPDTIKQQEGISGSPDAGWQFIRIRQGDRDHMVIWYNLSIWYDTHPDHEEFASDLRALYDYLIELIESKCAYQMLPPARGGYV